MTKLAVYNLAGKQVGEQELNASVFGVKVNPIVVQQVIIAMQANARKPWAHTKTKGEVRGGGKKPWSQKGTGRARQGSSRNPQWKGGGVTFGPRSNRNYKMYLNQKERQTALRMVLSDKAAQGQLILVDSLALPEVKTKQVVAALKQLPVKSMPATIVLDKEAKNMRLSSRNMASVNSVPAESLNALNLLKAQSIILPLSVLKVIDQLYAPKKKKA